MTKVQLLHNLTSQISTPTSHPFYRHTQLCSLEEVTADILALEEESEGLIKKLLF